jgi:hypothetical protein
MEPWIIILNLHKYSHLSFNIIFFQDVLIGFNMWYLLEKNMTFKKIYKNLHQQIVMSFWMTKFELYFQKFLSQLPIICC